MHNTNALTKFAKLDQILEETAFKLAGLAIWHRSHALTYWEETNQGWSNYVVLGCQCIPRACVLRPTLMSHKAGRLGHRRPL